MMLQLTRTAQQVPDVEEASVGAVPSGAVFVTTPQGTDPNVAAGEQVVLETAGGGRRELVTAAEYDGTPGGPGSYLATEDYLALSVRDNPTLRLYVKSDSRRKRLSRAGLLLQAPVIIGLVLAALGIYFGFATDKGTSAATVADRAQTLLAWVGEPSDPAQIRERSTQAQRCLAKLAGRDTIKPVVPDVSCTAKSPDWWRSPDTAAWVALAAGALTAFFSALATNDKFGFQQSPDS
jgi:hypothetical protein